MPTVYHQFPSLTETKNVYFGLTAFELASNYIISGIKLKICLIRFLSLKSLEM